MTSDQQFRAVMLKRAFDEQDLSALSEHKPGFWHGMGNTLLFPEAYRRAGRVSALGDSMGKDVPFSLRYPYLAQIMQTLGTGVAGAAAGGRAAPVTGALGVLGGILLNKHYRDSGENKVVGAVRQGLSLGNKPDAQAVGRPGSSLLTPVSGIFQQGRMDTAENILKGNRQFGTNPGTTALNVLQGGLPSYAAPESPLSWISSMFNNSQARGRADKLGLRPD